MISYHKFSKLYLLFFVWFLSVPFVKTIFKVYGSTITVNCVLFMCNLVHLSP